MSLGISDFFAFFGSKKQKETKRLFTLKDEYERLGSYVAVWKEHRKDFFEWATWDELFTVHGGIIDEQLEKGKQHD